MFTIMTVSQDYSKIIVYFTSDTKVVLFGDIRRNEADDHPW